MAKGKKASLVQCRIEACQKVDEIVEANECSISEAMRRLAGDNGVPYETIKYWYYRDEESSKSSGNVPPTQDPKNTAKAKAKVAAKIVKNINKALDNEEDSALAQANLDGARHLADELGGVVLAEEMYELFMKKIAELSEVITANGKLDDPVESTKITTLLLRLARNAGWEEYKPPKDMCEKCKVTCPDRTCENNTGGK
jgi:hypothetical protein